MLPLGTAHPLEMLLPVITHTTFVEHFRKIVITSGVFIWKDPVNEY
jgi:hypothetical protein